jgi:hypothetical protein
MPSISLWETTTFDKVDDKIVSSWSWVIGAYDMLTNNDDVKWVVMNGDKYNAPGLETEFGAVGKLLYNFNKTFGVEAWASANIMRDVDTNLLDGDGLFSNLGPMVSGMGRVITRFDGGHKLVVQGDVRYTWLNEENGDKGAAEETLYAGTSFNLGKGFTTSVQGLYSDTKEDADKIVGYVDLGVKLGSTDDSPVLTAYFMTTSVFTAPKDVGSSDVANEGEREVNVLDDRFTLGVKLATAPVSFNAEWVHYEKGPQVGDRPVAPQVDGEGGLPASDAFFFTATAPFTF